MSNKDSVKTKKSVRKKQNKTTNIRLSKNKSQKNSVSFNPNYKQFIVNNDTLKLNFDHKSNSENFSNHTKISTKNIDQYLSYQQRLFPYINNSAQKGCFLQSKLQSEKFFLSPRNHNLNIESNCARLAELLREKINSMKIQTITVDYNLDFATQLINDHENFDRVFLQFNKQYDKIQSIKIQLQSNIKSVQQQEVISNIENLELKNSVLLQKLQYYRKHLPTFLKVFSKKLEYDYYCLDTPSKIAAHFFILLEKFTYQRQYIFKQYEKIEQYVNKNKAFQYYGKQLNRGQLLDFNLKLNKDFDHEVKEKNCNLLDIQILINKDKKLKKFIQQNNMLRNKSPTDSLRQVLENTQRHSTKNFSKEQAKFSEIVNQINQKTSHQGNDYFSQIFQNKKIIKTREKETYADMFMKLKQELKPKNMIPENNENIRYFYRNKVQLSKVKFVYQCGGLKASKNILSNQ